MRNALILASLLAAAPARAWLLGSSASLEPARKAYEAANYRQVISELGGAGSLDRLRSADQRDGYLLLGMSHERLGDLDKALGVYQLGVKLFPKDINLLTNLAALLHSSGLEEQAEPLFQKVLRIHPNNAAAHLGLAEIDGRLGFLDRSAEHYDKALETMPDDPRIWLGYAEVLMSARDFKTAELAARKSLSLRETPEASFDLARSQRGAGRLGSALETLDQAVAKYPQRTDLALARALWLLEAGRYDDADAAAAPLLSAADPSPLAYWVRARVRLKRDEYRAAVEDLRRASGAGRAAPFVAAAAKELLKQLAAD